MDTDSDKAYETSHRVKKQTQVVDLEEYTDSDEAWSIAVIGLHLQDESGQSRDFLAPRRYISIKGRG